MLTKNMKSLIQEVKNEMRLGKAKAFDFNTPIEVLEKTQVPDYRSRANLMLAPAHSTSTLHHNGQKEEDPGLDPHEFRRLLEKVGLGED